MDKGSSTVIDLEKLVQFCDKELNTSEIVDYSGAQNGLQVENSGKVTKIGAAVDISLNTLQLACEKEIDLIIVHHGLFWTPRIPWTKATMKMIRTFIERDIALYSSHLPLDVHTTLGNNIQLVNALELQNPEPCGDYKGLKIGFSCDGPVEFSDLVSRAQKVLGVNCTHFSFGPSVCSKIAIVTGGAGSDIANLAAEGADTILTGEGPHWSYALAQELGINVIYGGHYATETFGVKALSSLIEKQFGIPWLFIDDPSQL